MSQLGVLCFGVHSYLDVQRGESLLHAGMLEAAWRYGKTKRRLVPQKSRGIIDSVSVRGTWGSSTTSGDRGAELLTGDDIRCGKSRGSVGSQLVVEMSWASTVTLSAFKMQEIPSVKLVNFRSKQFHGISYRLGLPSTELDGLQRGIPGSLPLKDCASHTHTCHLTTAFSSINAKLHLFTVKPR